MQIHLGNIIFILSIFLGALIVFLLTVPVSNRKHSNNLLAMYVFCFVLFSAHNFILQENLIIRVPFLFRITKPLQYAVAPLIFFYVRSVVFNEVHFRKWDWLFFLPMALHALELMPFFFMERELKISLIEAFMQNMNQGLLHTEGFLPAYIHPVLISFFLAIMIFKSWKMVKLVSDSTTSKSNPQNVMQVRWLNLFIFINTVVFCLLVLHMLTFKLVSWNVYRINNIEASGLLIAIGISLFFYPNILYGFQRGIITGADLLETKTEKNVDAEVHQDKGYSLSSERRYEYLARIKDCFEEKEVFLIQGYTIRSLSQDTGISYTYLSQVINQEYALNFNELVNSYRVEYVKKLMLEPNAHQYTFEALAGKAGFSSRTTFSRAFTRFAGCTPSEFVRLLAHH
jgi:AraC-like DNA-binding protein